MLNSVEVKQHFDCTAVYTTNVRPAGCASAWHRALDLEMLQHQAAAIVAFDPVKSGKYGTNPLIVCSTMWPQAICNFLRHPKTSAPLLEAL